MGVETGSCTLFENAEKSVFPHSRRDAPYDAAPVLARRGSVASGRRRSHPDLLHACLQPETRYLLKRAMAYRTFASSQGGLVDSLVGELAVTCAGQC